VRLEGLKKLKTSNYLIGNRTCNLPACSIMPQITRLPCTPVDTDILVTLYNFVPASREDKFCGVPYVFRKLRRTVDFSSTEIYFYLMTAALLASETLCFLTKSVTTELSNVCQFEINVGDRFPYEAATGREHLIYLLFCLQQKLLCFCPQAKRMIWRL
jgi:hypothetical protein